MSLSYYSSIIVDTFYSQTYHIIGILKGWNFSGLTNFSLSKNLIFEVMHLDVSIIALTIIIASCSYWFCCSSQLVITPAFSESAYIFEHSFQVHTHHIPYSGYTVRGLISVKHQFLCPAVISASYTKSRDRIKIATCSDAWSWILYYILCDQRKPHLQGYLVSRLVLEVTTMKLLHVQIKHWGVLSNHTELKSASPQQLA